MGSERAPRPGAARVLELALEEAWANPGRTPVQHLYAALQFDGDNDAHFHAYFLAMEVAGMGLESWWAAGEWRGERGSRSPEEVRALFDDALFQARLDG